MTTDTLALIEEITDKALADLAQLTLAAIERKQWAGLERAVNDALYQLKSMCREQVSDNNILRSQNTLMRDALVAIRDTMHEPASAAARQALADAHITCRRA